MSDDQEAARHHAGLQADLPRHIKLRRDEARDRWTILAPERVFRPTPIAVAVLQLCDGDAHHR